MISKQVFGGWLDTAIAFANLPKGFHPVDAESCLAGGVRARHSRSSNSEHLIIDLADDNQPWYGPLHDYATLHKEWVRFLCDLLREERTERITKRMRAWCEDLPTDDSILFANPKDYGLFGFDDEGHPHFSGMWATRPEGLLAIVGAELMAPNCAFEVLTCKSCDQFFARAGASHRSKGKPRLYCKRDVCNISTARLKANDRSE